MVTKKNSIIDLATLDTKQACERGFELELHHPVTTEPLGVFITVLGSDSEIFQSAIRRRANERLRKDFENQRRGKPNEAPTIEQAVSDSIMLLVSCTLAWRTGDKPIVKIGAQELEFNETNARALYQNKWIREQVDEAIGDLANFLSA